MHLHGRVANDDIAADRVSLNAHCQKDTIRIPNDRVLLDHVARICRSYETDTEVVALGRKSIPTEPVPTEPVTACAASQSYTATWIYDASVSH